MASTITQSLFANTYKDDYRDSDNYHRILFNSGRALQARELTQMQTIIQSEIARFGRNIFKEGASVNPGGPTINPNYEFVKLDTTSYALPSSGVVGTIFRGATSGQRAEVIEVIPAGSDPATLYVKYVGGVGTAIGINLRFSAGEILTNDAVTLAVQTTNTSVNPAVGLGVRFSIGSGDFFTQGHFVFAEAQSIVLSKYSDTYTGTVGFIVTEDVVTATDNSALYDNQGTVPNTTAPGADRYRIRLTLADETSVSTTQTFIYLAKIVDSKIVDNVTGTDEYNNIEKIMAKRTKEESGDYIVRPFILKFNADSADTTKLSADISPGIAYINGHRVEVASPTKIRISKPTSTINFNNQPIVASYGNYVMVSTIKGLADTNKHDKLILTSAITFGGTAIGSARVRSIEKDGVNYRYYITDVKMTGTNKFSAVRSIGLSITNYADLILENSIAVIKDAANNDLLFPLPQVRPKNLTDISLQVQRRFTTTSGTGTASLSGLSLNETFVDTTNWIIVGGADSNLTGVVSVALSGSPASTTATISGLPLNGPSYNAAALKVLAYVNRAAGTVASKTLTQTTKTAAILTDSSGNKYIDLGKADVWDVTRIRATNSDGADLTNYFRFDNGQKDNFYDTGKLILKSTFAAPTTNVFARFRYFTHGVGDFFAATSYDSSISTGIPYAKIPTLTLTNGTTINLRDYLDFRPRIGDNGVAFDNIGDVGGSIRQLPKNGNIVNVDVDYYLPRYDKLIVDELGNIITIQGSPDLSPTFPETPANTLDLYRIKLNANTLTNSDLSVTAIEHKRYTMDDIGKLEKRIDRLEEYTTLSLLELETSSWAVVDSTGIGRTKAGFLADGFNDFTFSDTTSQEYRAAIDPKTNLVRPTTVLNNIRLKYDSAASSNTILKGDNVYIKYVEDSYIKQTFMSGTENVNPFAVVFNEGFMQLSPASDEWKETQVAGVRVIDGGTRIDTSQTRNFNEWQWQWQGLTGNLTGVIAGVTTTSRRRGGLLGFFGFRRRTTTVTRVVSDETIRQVVGERVVDVAVIPFMRSRKIAFKATGLIPRQQYWPFFDGVSVAAWCKKETSFTRFADTTTDWGSTQNRAVKHPEVAASFPNSAFNLSTDSNGTLIGSFFIPNTDALRFRTGEREFKVANANSPADINATSAARETFVANGAIETVDQTVVSTRVITLASTTVRRRRRIDPLAQTFLVDTDDGVFLTKVAIYFKTKPTGTQTPSPVMVEIRPVVNGYPSSDVSVPGSMVILTPSQVNVAATQTEAGVLAAPTYFTFEEPIYLSGQTEYCIVILTDSTAYNVYVAETQKFILGSTEKRIGQQPSLGSLFKSQNATTWEPDQTKDLMFKLYRAVFSTAPSYAVLENVDVPLTILPADPIRLDSASRWATISHPNHGLDSGDIVRLYGLDSAVLYSGIRGSSILGQNVISYPDATGYQIYIDSATAAGVKAFVGGTNVRASQNLMFDIVNPHIDVLSTPNTTITLDSKLTSGRSLAGEEVRWVKEATYTPTMLKEDNYLEAPQVIAYRDVEIASLSGARSASLRVNMSTTSSNVSPVVDMQRSSLILVNNLIDKQSTDRSAVGFNVPLSYKAETDPTDGTHVAKHVTVPVTLSDAAVGLQVILGANRPSVADFQVYYRTATTGQNIRLLPWFLTSVDATIPSDEDFQIFREYKYLIGQKNGILPPFTQYQLKIVFRSTNSSKVPTITDLRVIALAD